MEKKICIICHKEFTKTRRNQKYCSKECSEIAEKERQQVRSKEYRETHMIMMARKTPQEGMELLNKHVREADKLGLSYGKYMAKRRMQGGKK